MGSCRGSPSPFATLQHAADLAGPGDVVFVADGNYAGFAGVGSGAQGAPITFWASGPNVVIDRAGTLSNDGGIDLRQPNSPLSDISIEGFKFLGVPAFGVWLSWTTRVVIRGCTFENCGLSGGRSNVYGGHTPDALIENNEISGAGEHGIYIANSRRTRPSSPRGCGRCGAKGSTFPQELTVGSRSPASKAAARSGRRAPSLALALRRLERAT